MPKALKVAGEVDSWCTKCRLVLNHRIVSMKAGKAYQVECLTCRTTHLWRAHAPGEKAAASGGHGGTRGAASVGSAPSRAARVTPAMRHEQSWEKAIAGKAVHEFKSYNVGGSFRE